MFKINFPKQQIDPNQSVKDELIKRLAGNFEEPEPVQFGPPNPFTNQTKDVANVSSNAPSLDNAAAVSTQTDNISPSPQESMAEPKFSLLNDLARQYLTSPDEKYKKPTFSDVTDKTSEGYREGGFLGGIQGLLKSLGDYSTSSEGQQLLAGLSSNPYQAADRFSRSQQAAAIEREKEKEISGRNDKRRELLMNVWEKSVDRNGQLDIEKFKKEAEKAMKENEQIFKTTEEEKKRKFEEAEAMKKLLSEEKRTERSASATERSAGIHAGATVEAARINAAAKQQGQNTKKTEQQKQLFEGIDSTSANLRDFYNDMRLVKSGKILGSSKLGAVKQAVKVGSGFGNVPETEFDGARALLISNVARNLGGEKGVLTEQDTARINKGLPQFKDSNSQREAKMKVVEKFLNNRIDSYNNSRGESMPHVSLSDKNLKQGANKSQSKTSAKTELTYDPKTKTFK